MADFDSSLPVRTESVGDLDIFVSDSQTPANKLKVNADGSLDVNSTVSATDLDIRDLSASQDNVAISDGTESLAINVDGSINAVVTATDLDIRDLSAAQDSISISDGTETLAINVDGSINSVVTATDLDIRDLTSASDSVEVLQATHDNLNLNANVQVGDADVSNTNPLPVYMEENAGTEIVDYQTSASIAAGSSATHDYTVTASTTFLGEKAWISGSGKFKVEVQLETAAASGTYDTVFVAFNSTSMPNVDLPLEKIVKQVAGANVRVVITNRDKQPQDLYSTLIGIERS